MREAGVAPFEPLGHVTGEPLWDVKDSTLKPTMTGVERIRSLRRQRPRLEAYLQTVEAIERPMISLKGVVDVNGTPIRELDIREILMIAEYLQGHEIATALDPKQRNDERHQDYGLIWFVHRALGTLQNRYFFGKGVVSSDNWYADESGDVRTAVSPVLAKRFLPRMRKPSHYRPDNPIAELAGIRGEPPGLSEIERERLATFNRNVIHLVQRALDEHYFPFWREQK